jgi:RimJ/RimL family protein N-acetyltransferase
MDYRLTTPRLHLRPCTLVDLPAVHALWLNEQIRQFLFDDRVISEAETREFIEGSLSNFKQHGYGLWLVFTNETNSPMGFAGALWTEGLPSLIYGIHPDAGGWGYATEAAGVVLDYLLTQLHYPKVIADVDEPNLASIRVLQKLGMTQTRRAIVNERPLLYFECC